MNPSSGSQTSPTLLGRLRQEPIDQAAWSELVERYGRRIFSWCRQGGLQEADAEDVTQMVLVRLAERMRTFSYDPAKSFRGWLRTLTRHAWSDFVPARQRGGEERVGSAASAGEAAEAVLERLKDRPPETTLPFRPRRLGADVASPPAQRSPLPRVPGYEVLEEIDRGGMGVIYRERHVVRHRKRSLRDVDGRE